MTLQIFSEIKYVDFIRVLPIKGNVVYACHNNYNMTSTNNYVIGLVNVSIILYNILTT